VSSVMWNGVLLFLSCGWWCTVFGTFSAWVNGVGNRKVLFMTGGLL
jgi:hypothetical protein